jgi:hypothetical protein
MASCDNKLRQLDFTGSNHHAVEYFSFENIGYSDIESHPLNLFCKNMSVIQSPVILIIAVGLVIIIAVALVRSREDSEWGLKDVVKKPAYWDSSIQAQQEANEATAAAKTWSADKVASATRHFIFEVPSSREAWVEARILRDLDQRTWDLNSQ